MNSNNPFELDLQINQGISPYLSDDYTGGFPSSSTSIQGITQACGTSSAVPATIKNCSGASNGSRAISCA